MPYDDAMRGRIIAAVRRRRVLSCRPGPCDHTQLQHDAFDLGVADGEAGSMVNPFADPLERDAWESGHSVAYNYVPPGKGNA
jgi:hypothetical protein